MWLITSSCQSIRDNVTQITAPRATFITVTASSGMLTKQELSTKPDCLFKAMREINLFLKPGVSQGIFSMKPWAEDKNILG